MSRTSINYIKTGKVIPSLKTANEITKVLGLAFIKCLIQIELEDICIEYARVKQKRGNR